MTCRDLPPKDEARLRTVAEWVRQTCDMLGAEPSTGYKCAAAFYEGLKREWEQRTPQSQDGASSAPGVH